MWSAEEHMLSPVKGKCRNHLQNIRKLHAAIYGEDLHS